METKDRVMFEIGKTYRFAGYDWTACDLINKGKTLVIQSHGVTHGMWPGYVMPQFGNGDYYGKSIDGQDISDYDDKIRALYDSIKDVEDTKAPYGKGLFLLSKEKVCYKEWGMPGFGNYWLALLDSAENSKKFEALNLYTWLGNVSNDDILDKDFAWCVYKNGAIYDDCDQENDLVVAPAFNIDLSKVEVVGDEIVIKE